MRYKNIGVVVIGRNEGERLKKCLHSIVGMVSHIVYVDSGSSDDSVSFASGLGVHIVDLDMSQPFTAARARNEGFDKLLIEFPDVEFVQFVDGDCEFIEGWFENALSAFVLDKEKDSLAVVFGLCKERFPNASIYNDDANRGWKIPTGYTETCGGNTFVSVEAFNAVGGFNQALIAGEEPDLCLRLRRTGWKILSIPYDMVWHDVNILKFSQWVNRAVRTGHAFAEVAWRHRKFPEKYWFRHNARVFSWGLLLPIAFGLLSLYDIRLLGLFIIYPVQVVRIAMKEDWLYAYFCVLVKFPQAIGQAKFFFNQLLGKKSTLIEYK